MLMHEPGVRREDANTQQAKQNDAATTKRTRTWKPASSSPFDGVGNNDLSRAEQRWNETTERALQHRRPE